MFPLWSRGTSGLLGLAWAAECSHLLTWAEPAEVTLWQAGSIIQQRRAAQPLHLGACAADGSAFAVVSKTGRLWRLGAELRTHWELQLPSPALALAFDPLGTLLAVSDSAGRLHLLDAAQGKALWRVEPARPLHHLAFVPEQPLLIGAADTGLVTAYDPAGICVWRSGLPAHIGSLAVQGDGKRIVLAGYGEGPCCFDATGQRRHGLERLGPCRRLALSFDGQIVLREDLQGRLIATISDGVELASYTPTGRILGLALAPLGDRLVLALQNGELHELGLGRSESPA